MLQRPKPVPDLIVGTHNLNENPDVVRSTNYWLFILGRLPLEWPEYHQETSRTQETIRRDTGKVDCSWVDLVLLKMLLKLKCLQSTTLYHQCLFSRNRVHSLCEGIQRAREGFRLIARRAAVCYDCASHMKEVDPIYQLSFWQFLDFYDAAIAHSDRWCKR